MNIKDLTTDQLKQIITIKQQIADLETQLESISGGNGRKLGRPKGLAKPRGNRKMSVAGRKAIALAAKKRWAAYRGEGKADKPAKRTMSAATKRKIAAAAIERWKKAKAAGKATL